MTELLLQLAEYIAQSAATGLTTLGRAALVLHATLKLSEKIAKATAATALGWSTGRALFLAATENLAQDVSKAASALTMRGSLLGCAADERFENGLSVEHGHNLQGDENVSIVSAP